MLEKKHRAALAKQDSHKLFVSTTCSFPRTVFSHELFFPTDCSLQPVGAIVGGPGDGGG